MKSIKFRKLHKKLQSTLQNDIDSIKKSRNMFIFANNTRNIYKTDKSTDQKMLNNIAKTYRKSNNTVYSKINKETKQIAIDYEIADRIDCLGKVDAFISLKDYEDNFLSNPQYRLINPVKGEIGKNLSYSKY